MRYRKYFNSLTSLISKNVLSYVDKYMLSMNNSDMFQKNKPESKLRACYCFEICTEIYMVFLRKLLKRVIVILLYRLPS